MNNGFIRYNIIKFVTFFLLTLIYQQIAPALRIAGVVPNLSFLLVLSAAMAESHTGLVYPLIFGLINDHMNGIVFGVYVIMYVAITFVAGELYHKNFENVTFIEILFVILGCFLYSFLNVMFISLMGESFWNLFLKISLPEFLYNSILGIIVFLVYKKMSVTPVHFGGRRRRNSAWRV